MGSEELRFVIAARDEASGVLRGIGGPKGFGGLKMRAIAAVAAIAVAIGVVIGKLIDLGETFDAAFDTIRIGTGATGAGLEGLKDDFKAVFADVPSDAATVSQAIADLNTRLGLTGQPLQTMATQFLNLSRITKTDVNENIRLGTRLFGDWSIASKNQADAMDLVFRASQQSGIGISDLMGTVVQFGAPLRNMGFGFEESIAMLSKWEKEGVNTSTVLTGMKFALKTFAKAGEDPQKALEQLIPVIRDAKDEQKAMALGMQTFGLRAGPDMVAAIREGRFEYADFAAEIKNGKDTIAAATRDTDDWREAWEQLKHRGMVALEPVATSLFKALGAGMDGLIAVVDYLGPRFSTAWGWVSKAVSDAWAVVGPVVSAIYEHVKVYLIDNLSAAMPTLTAMWGEFQTTLSSVADRARGFASAVAAAIGWVVDFIRERWGAIGPIVRNVWTVVEAYVKTALNVIAETIRLVMAVIRGDWSGAWGQVKAIVRAAWDGIKTVVSNALGALKKILSGLGGKILGWIGDLGTLLWGKGKALIAGLIGGVKEKAATLWAWVTNLPGKVLAKLGDLSTTLYDAGRALIKGLLEGIVDKFEAVKTFVEGIGSWIENHKGPLGYDLKLLRPAGQAIIEGLRAGIADQLGTLYSEVAAIGPHLSVAASPSFAFAGSAYSAAANYPAAPAVATPASATAPVGAGGGTDVYVFLDSEPIAARVEVRQQQKARRSARLTGAF